MNNIKYDPPVSPRDLFGVVQQHLDDELFDALTVPKELFLSDDLRAADLASPDKPEGVVIIARNTSHVHAKRTLLDFGIPSYQIRYRFISKAIRRAVELKEQKKRFGIDKRGVKRLLRATASVSRIVSALQKIPSAPELEKFVGKHCEEVVSFSEDAKRLIWSASAVLEMMKQVVDSHRGAIDGMGIKTWIEGD